MLIYLTLAKASSGHFTSNVTLLTVFGLLVGILPVSPVALVAQSRQANMVQRSLRDEKGGDAHAHRACPARQQSRLRRSQIFVGRCRWQAKSNQIAGTRRHWQKLAPSERVFLIFGCYTENSEKASALSLAAPAGLGGVPGSAVAKAGVPFSNHRDTWNQIA
jgi:hypothetical protein